MYQVQTIHLISLLTRSPSLRDAFDANGDAIAGVMHNALVGHTQDIDGVLDHYNSFVVETGNNNIDPVLTPGGNPQQLNMTQTERDAVKAFLLTLSGSSVYTDERWSDPFDANGNLTVIGGTTNIAEQNKSSLQVYPNPAQNFIQLSGLQASAQVAIFDFTGRQQMEADHSSK